MITLSPSRIFLLCFSLALAAGSWLILAPRMRSISLVQAEVQDVTAKLTQPVVAQQTNSQTHTFQADAAAAKLKIPETDGQYDMVTKIESVVRSSGLVVGGISVTPVDTPVGAPTGSTLKGLSISLSTQGSYAQIAALADKLTSLDRLITITSLNLSQGTKDTGLTAQITANAYYLPSSSK